MKGDSATRFKRSQLKPVLVTQVELCLCLCVEKSVWSASTSCSSCLGVMLKENTTSNSQPKMYLMLALVFNFIVRVCKSTFIFTNTSSAHSKGIIMSTFPLSKAIQVLFFFFLAFAGLYYARSFLVPVALAGLLSMLFLPLSRWMENKGLNRGLAALICVLLVVSALAGLVWLITWQITDLTNDVNNIEQRVQQTVNSIRNSISKNLGITKEQQAQLVQGKPGGGKAAGMLTGAASAIMGILVDLVLVLVYIFMFLYFRRHLKTFVLKLVPPAEKSNAQTIIQDIQRVAQQYLGGLGMMIVCLWIMYGIGFSIVGVKNAIFFAVLCGILEIVPFVGNLTGSAITVLMVISQGGGTGMVIGVVITYAIVQFIQTYILEPLVVGAEVNINPLFTIVVLVIGELVWGIAGMVLAIPLLGIVKIVCDHIEPLKPYGFLIGQEKKRRQKKKLF